MAADEAEAPTSPPAGTGGQACEPGDVFAPLVGALGEETVGRCVENVSVTLATGDAEQRTARGLLVRRKDGVTAFTDGTTTWYGCGGAPLRRAARDPAPC